MLTSCSDGKAMLNSKISQSSIIFLIKNAFSAHLHFASEIVPLAGAFAFNICNAICITCDDGSVLFG